MKNIANTILGPRLCHSSLAAGLALLTLTACESLTGVAPKDTPRVEIELAVVVDDEFADPLEGVDQDSPLFVAVKQTILDEADLGLRFYPTFTERYGEGDRHPPYLMTVELETLVIGFDEEMVESEGEEPRLVATVDGISCKVRARVERRRDGAPSLIVATASTSSRVGVDSKAAAKSKGNRYSVDRNGQELHVIEADILRAVESATSKALKSMRTPIDREFAVEAPADAAGSTTSEK